jgi:hypothetical protein
LYDTNGGRSLDDFLSSLSGFPDATMASRPVTLLFTFKRITYGMHPLAEPCVTPSCKLNADNLEMMKSEAVLMKNDWSYTIRQLQMIIDVGKIIQVSAATYQ